MRPTCGNCKHLIIAEADEDTKKWGFQTEEYCGKYENFVKGLPVIPGKIDRLMVYRGMNAFSCRYHKYLKMQVKK